MAEGFAGVGIFRLEMTLLTPLQAKFLDLFFTTYLGPDFFLSGGTALAEYYLKHRLSQDLDLFTLDQNIGFDAVNAEIIKIIHAESWTVEDQVISESFLRYILRTGEGLLKTDLVKDVPVHFGKIKTEGRVKIDSLENIATGKLLALFGRADPKDFIDLYFLWEKEKIMSFEETLKMAKEKDLGLQEFYLAEMIAKAEEINTFPETIKPFNRQELVDYFLNLNRTLLLHLKPAE